MLASARKAQCRQPGDRCLRALPGLQKVIAGFHAAISRHRNSEGGKHYLAGIDPVAAEGIFVSTHFGGWNAWPSIVRLSMIFRRYRGHSVSVGSLNVGLN